MRRLLVLLVAIVILAAASSGARRSREAPELHRNLGGLFQQHAGHTLGAPPPGVAVVVDGATNPELISDERAYGHFLSAMASADAKTVDVALKKVGLELPDRAAFVASLGRLGDELAAATEFRRTGLAERALQYQRAAIEGARSRIRQAVSATGRSQVDAYVRNEVKRRITIYRGPAVLPSHGGVR